MLRTIVFLFFGLLGLSANAADKPAPLTFDIPVVTELAEYTDYLAVPAYAALALENIGLGISLSSRLTVISRDNFKIKLGSIKFKSKKGGIYTYEASVSDLLGITEKTISIPVELDTGSIAKGTLQIRLYLPLANLVPQSVIEKIEFKLRALANVQTQRKLLAYLAALKFDDKGKPRGFEGVLELIVFDALNRIESSPHIAAAGVAGTPRDTGSSELLTDQTILVITLVIWLGGFPVFLYIVRRRRDWQSSQKTGE
jgi:hypothetical protein